MQNVIEDSFVSFFEHSLLDPPFHLFCRVVFAVIFAVILAVAVRSAVRFAVSSRICCQAFSWLL